MKARTLWRDASRIEALHATVRRLLLLASHQTHRQEFGDLSSQFVLMPSRTKKDAARKPTVAKGKAKLRKESKRYKKTKKEPKQKRRTGGGSSGGAWRAWVRMHRLGGRGLGDLGQLAGEYRTARLANTAAYQRACRLGSSAHAAARRMPRGKSPFGRRTKDTVRDHVRRAQESLWRFASQLQPGERYTAFAHHATLYS